jgi:hypothetical protein
MSDDDPTWHPTDPSQAAAEAAHRFQVDTLVGCTVDEARQRVEAAGGRFQGYGHGDALTAEFRTNRVRALIEDGRVVSASVG